MAPLKLLMIGGLMACVGCSGGNLPSGGVYAADAHVGVDADIWADVSPTEAAFVDAVSDAYCPMNCGVAPWAATRVDGTCTFLLPCGRIDGDFTRLYVIVDDSQIPQSQSEGWAYTDASPPALELHGQVCADLLSGAKTTVTFSIGCSLP